MCFQIGIHQVGTVHLGVNLGGRERGVAQQFLNGAQVAAGAQQMGGEGMAQGVGCGAGGHAESGPQLLHF